MAAPTLKNTCQFFALLTLFVAAAGGEKRSEKVIQLDSTSWKETLEGEWFLEFYAPWCPACQNFAGKYEEFAKHAPTYNIKVAKIDITENPALSGRFLITSLPTIFYIRDGSVRHYQGARGLQDMLGYVRNDLWQADQPVPWYKAPNSIPMTIVSWFFELSVYIRSLHEMMTEEFGVPVWGSYVVFAVVTLIAGLALGMVLVLLCDCLCPHAHSRPLDRPTPDKYDKVGNDSDVADENEESKDEDTSDAANKSSPSAVRKRKPRKDT